MMNRSCTLKKSFTNPPNERMIGGPKTKKKIRPEKKPRYYDKADPDEEQENED